VTRALSRLCLPWASDIGPQRHQFLADRACGGAFDLPVTCDERQAERRQHGAAAVLAAGLPLDRGMAADAVDLVDQIPDISIARPAAEIEPLALMFSSN
jgi:hypothetical protein